MENKLFEKPIYFIPFGEAQNRGDFMGKLHLSDSAKLHISKFVEYVNLREDLKNLPPSKTLFMLGDLPQGQDAAIHLKDIIGDEIHLKFNEALSFDFWEGRSQEKLIKRGVVKICDELIKASAKKYELVVIIGDNTFPFIMDRIGSELNLKTTFLEFSKKGRLLYPITLKPYNDAEKRAFKRMQEKYVGETLLAGHQYYIRKDRSIVTIKDSDEYAGGTFFVGQVENKSEEIFWLKNGKNPYTPDLDIIGRIS